MAGIPLTTNQAIAHVIPHEGVASRFLFYQLLGRRADLVRLGKGGTQRNISQGVLRSFSVVIAPRLEQHRIADEIETQLTRLDAAVANLERVRANLKRARASVLKAAVEGRLVPTEAELARADGRPYEHGSHMLERILKERRRLEEEAELGSRVRQRYSGLAEPEMSELPDPPEGWIWASCDAVGEILLGRQRAPQHLSGRWSRPYLRVANVKDDRVDTSDLKIMDFDPTHFEKYRLRPGDVLVSEGQSPDLVGQSAIYEGGIEGLCFQKTLHRWRPFANGPSSRFAQLVFRAWVRTGVFKARASITTNIAHLTLTKFKRCPFPLPPEREQLRIVSEVERRLSVFASIDETIVKLLARASRLRQSILSRAFQGKLVPHDPNDEPASELLARIQSRC